MTNADHSQDRPDAEAATHDVAISFLAKDEGVAVELCERLSGLNVFFFPRKQEELAGTNGLESMRAPFLNARVVVVLFRNPWGDTNWTRVEQAAITDRFLKEGWKWLLFVQLDQTSTLPAWLPETDVRFALEQYGIEQLAGAVKMRVQERGGEIHKPSAMDRARQVQREAERRKDEADWFQSEQWIRSNIHPTVVAILQQTVEAAEEIRRELGMNFVELADGMRCILRTDRVSLNIGWRQPFSNRVDEEAGLIGAEFNGPLFFPAERKMTVFHPSELGRLRFQPALSLAREIVWKDVSSNAAPISAEDLSQAFLTKFLNLLDRSNRGEIEGMFT